MEKEKKIEKLWDKGEKLYDSFLEKLFGEPRSEIRASNPTTNALELFALLDRHVDKSLIIGAMCSQVAHDIEDETLFAEKGKLFRKETTKERLY